MTKSRKSASKRSPLVKRGPASKRPRRKKGRASLTMRGLDNGSARVSQFAAGALAVFTRGVHRQLAVLAKKKIPTAAIVDGQIVRGIPRKVGTRYVLDALQKGSRS